MDLVEGSVRSFIRSNSQLQVLLQLSDWPVDVPLPQGVNVMTFGNGPFPISYLIILKADKTIQSTTSWFIMPHSIADTRNWYNKQILKQGQWHHKRNDEKVIQFYQPQQDIHLTVSLTWHRWLKQTQALIKRSVMHPWPQNGNKTDRFEYALWPFVRGKDWIRIDLKQDLWPASIPLFEATQPAPNNSTPNTPYWQFQFKPNKTIETVGGTFITPKTIENITNYYGAKLKKLGWFENKTGDILTQPTKLHYHHLEKGGDLTLNLQNQKEDKTHFTIKWERIHPWQPS